MNANQTNPPRSGTNSKRRRRYLPWIGLFVLAALIVAGLWPRSMPVEAAPIRTGTLRSTVNEEGKTRIRQRYVIASPVAGQLRRIPFKAGFEVQSTDTVLAVIDPTTPILLDERSRALAVARRDSAVAQLDRARAAHKFATNELERNEKLFQEKTISPQEREVFQWREISASREVVVAEATLRLAEAELMDATNAGSTNGPRAVELHSPICGRVLKVFEESARTVPAGTPLVEVGDPKDLEVIIEVLSRDGAALKHGTPVEFDQWGGPEPLKGIVRYVEPAAFTKVSALGVEEQRVWVVADLLTRPEQRGNLGDNFRVEASIITWQTDRALKVPSGALFRRGEQWNVYVIEAGRARLRPVKIGRTSGTETELLEGLKEGEEVILYPGDRIKDGLHVKIVKI